MAELNASPQRAGSARGRRKMSTRVDLTAMVDLAFLLITFFIMTTTLAKPKAMDITMPDNTGPEPGPVAASRSLTVCIGKNNKLVYYLGELKSPIIAPQITGTGKDGIRKTLLETAKMIHDKYGKDMFVLVKPSDHAAYKSLVSVIDELNITQTSRYAITGIAGDDIAMLKQQNAY